MIKIPRPNAQILSYFCNEKLNPGAAVKISIRNRKIKAIVLESKNLNQEKLRLKKLSDFEIKPIDKILSKEPVLTEKQLALLVWLSEYYFAPIGLFARIFLARRHSSSVSTGVETTEDIQKLILTPKTKGLVFSAFKKLKSIIVENSESELYKSWGRRPYYDVRTIAKQLAKIHNARIKIVRSRRIGLGLKNSKLIDLREEMKNGNYSIISRELQEKLEQACLSAGRSILFIARRGTSTIVLCRECGYVAMCKNCDVPMVYHEDKASRKLVCHHCGKDDIAPVLCPDCKSIKIKYLGAGTQKVESEIKRLCLNKKILRLDSDISEKPAEQQKIINEFNNSENAILIASQMILNKGLKADLVAIISLDTILNLPDYQSTERVFNIISELRKMADKVFLIQTYNPENYVFKYAINNDVDGFYKEEMEIRKKFNYPPFSQIIKLTFEHKDPIKAKNEARILFEKLKTYKIKIFGPVPSFVSRVAGKYRWNIIIKNNIEDLNIRNKILIIIPSSWEVEVDPDDLL